MFGKYTHAVVSRIPQTVGKISELKKYDGEFDVEEAKTQYEDYVKCLRELNLDVIELPPDSESPESVFIEDTCIIHNGIALMAKPAASNRAKEIENIKAVIKKELGLAMVEIADPNAKLDGGDVLFTGREFFVGIGKYTNESGAKAVAATFAEFPCVPIKMTENHKLKYYVTMAGENLLAVSANGKWVLKRIEREATFSYQTLTLSEEESGNVLYINGVLVHRSLDEIPTAYQIINEKIDIPRKILTFTELGKLSQGLSSCCLLVNLKRYIRNL